MKFNKLLIALALCAAMQPNMSFGSQSYYQQYAPQRMQDLSGYISQKATSAYDTVNKWSTKKKLIVAGSILTALAAIYNRDQIMQWVSEIIAQRQEEMIMQKFQSLSDTEKRTDIEWGIDFIASWKRFLLANKEQGSLTKELSEEGMHEIMDTMNKLAPRIKDVGMSKEDIGKIYFDALVARGCTPEQASIIATDELKFDQVK